MLLNSRGRRITFTDTTLNITEWAIRTGVSYQALKGRLRNGWSLDRALATPQGPKRGRVPKIVEFRGEALTVTDWAARIGITEPTMRKRLSNPAWTLEEALTAPNVRGCRSDLGKRPA